jgi:hypothetical protein
MAYISDGYRFDGMDKPAPPTEVAKPPQAKSRMDIEVRKGDVVICPFLRKLSLLGRFS